MGRDYSLTIPHPPGGHPIEFYGSEHGAGAWIKLPDGDRSLSISSNDVEGSSNYVGYRDGTDIGPDRIAIVAVLRGGAEVRVVVEMEHGRQVRSISLRQILKAVADGTIPSHGLALLPPA